MIKSFEDNGVTWTLDVRHIFTRHKMWLDDFANIPHFFSVAFANNGEFLKAKDRLIPEPGSGARCTGHENVCGEIRVHFTADTKEAAYRWKAEHFDPLFREQAVDFYKRNAYLPYNFAGAFCDLKPGAIIEFHGRIPCWAADCDKVNPLTVPQKWVVVSSDDADTTLARQGKEYSIDTSSLFDENVFLVNYIQTDLAAPGHVNCAKFVYVDPSLLKTKTDSLEDKIRSASSRNTEPQPDTNTKNNIPGPER